MALSFLGRLAGSLLGPFGGIGGMIGMIPQVVSMFSKQKKKVSEDRALAAQQS